MLQNVQNVVRKTAELLAQRNQLIFRIKWRSTHPQKNKKNKGLLSSDEISAEKLHDKQRVAKTSMLKYASEEKGKI